jgi:type I restriction enzyme, S subunit
MAIKKSELYSSFWQSCDELRGGMDASQYTHKRISRGALGRLKIMIPEITEQTAIASILSDMDAEIATLETKLAKTRQLKQGMMHNLLTGRIRLV